MEGSSPQKAPSSVVCSKLFSNVTGRTRLLVVVHIFVVLSVEALAFDLDL